MGNLGGGGSVKGNKNHPRFFPEGKYMPTWLRSIFGLAAGGLNLFANGTNWKQVLLSVAVAGIGVASHLTSMSGSLGKLKPGITVPIPGSHSKTERF